MLRPPFFVMRRALTIVACCLAALAARADPLVVPQPASMTVGAGELVLDSKSTVWHTNAPLPRRVAGRLRGLFNQVLGVDLAPRYEKAKAAIRLELSNDATLGAEGYRLEATTEHVTITAASIAGLNHGVSTLVQVAHKDSGRVVVPAMTIVDAPRFAWRGVMIDSARHFQSPEYLRKFIDWMALHKLNVLHWHLTDDQGWRLQVPGYPKLMSAAWRVPAGAGATDIDSRTQRPRVEGGFYRREDVRMLVAHAATRGITIVPEIDMPGHASAAMAAYPWLAAIADPPRQVPADWGIYPNVYSLDESTFKFVEDVLREVMLLFPSRYIHVGGDEVIRDQWLSPRGRARMVELGIDDPAKVEPYFTQRIGKFLAAHGRRLVGWDEILEPGLDSGSVVMSWRGTKGALEAAKKGYDTVVAAHPAFYFDSRQSARAEEPPGRATTVTVEDVYDLDPMPPGLSPEEQRHVLGVQGNVWTEHIRTEERVTVMAFPRAAAVAELGWAPAASHDKAAFRKRLDALMPIYERVGLAEAARLDALRQEPTAAPAALARTSRELELCGSAIPLMLEDDAPREGPRAVFTLDIANPCWIFRAAPMDRVRAVQARVGQVPFNFQIGDDVKKIHFAVPQTKVGELEVHSGTCEGPVLARLPLEPATRSQGVTTLPAAPIAAMTGSTDLCMRFAQPSLEPLWAIDAIELLERAP